MKNAKSRSLFWVSLFLISSEITVLAGEVENEREFDYSRGSSIGPERWGEIHEEWAECGHGDMQSPIDLAHERVEIQPNLGKLKRKYKPSKAIIKNRGHDIMLKWEDDAGSIYINGTKYMLKQCHWHAPSEHTVNGRRFDLEVHLVHESADKKNAVIGIMYKIGRPDNFLSELMKPVKAIADTKEAECDAGMVDPRHIKLGSRKYYRYVGSLTVPPCTEGVVWTITRKIRTVSREQVQLLREAVDDNAEVNARPLQPINKRAIHFYRPNVKSGVPSAI